MSEYPGGDELTPIPFEVAQPLFEQAVELTADEIAALEEPYTPHSPTGF